MKIPPSHATLSHRFVAIGPPRAIERMVSMTMVTGWCLAKACSQPGVVEIGTTEWRFSGTALRRTRLALRLERDLELNLAGVALALDLMEEVERLRRALGERM